MPLNVPYVQALCNNDWKIYQPKSNSMWERLLLNNATLLELKISINLLYIVFKLCQNCDSDKEKKSLVA